MSALVSRLRPKARVLAAEAPGAPHPAFPCVLHPGGLCFHVVPCVPYNGHPPAHDSVSEPCVGPKKGPKRSIHPTLGLSHEGEDRESNSRTKCLSFPEDTAQPRRASGAQVAAQASVPRKGVAGLRLPDRTRVRLPSPSPPRLLPSLPCWPVQESTESVLEGSLRGQFPQNVPTLDLQPQPSAPLWCLTKSL